MSQTSYTLAPRAGRPGVRSDAAHADAVTVVMAEDGEPGRLLVREDQTPDPVPRAVAPAALAADADAIIATGASSDEEQTYEAAQFDGVVGSSYLPVPAQISLVLDASADWDATTAVLTGIDETGVEVSENLSISDGGDETVTSTNSYWAVTSLVIPAQTGDGGTFTLGVAATGRELTGAQILGVLEEDESLADPRTIPADREASAFRSRRIWVETDQLVPVGAPAFVRVVAGEGEAAGVFRADADGGDAIAVSGARFVRAESATLAELELTGGF